MVLIVADRRLLEFSGLEIAHNATEIHGGRAIVSWVRCPKTAQERLADASVAFHGHVFDVGIAKENIHSAQVISEAVAKSSQSLHLIDADTLVRIDFTDFERNG